MSDAEALIEQATDETLTSDDWRLIMEACDAVSASPERNTKVAIKTIKTRLSSKDANVILRTLSLLVALAENCGSRMQQEIAATSFLQDHLMKKLGDRKLHKKLKVQIAETIAQLNTSFKGDPSLRPITVAYEQLTAKYSHYLTALPDKPAKKELSYQERDQQDLELERALKLSVQEYEREQTMRKAYLSEKPLPTAGDPVPPKANTATAQSYQPNQERENISVGDDSAASIASVKKVRALYDLISYEPDELSFRKGDVITVIESVYRDWWRGSLPNGQTGIFPLNYVTPVVAKTARELAQEQQIEADLMNVTSRKIGKLLSLLSSNPGPEAEEEITHLYNSIIPHRATLAKLIDSYSLRKDELRLLNDKLSQKTKAYNDLLDSLVVLRQNAVANGPLSYPSGQPEQSYKQHSTGETGHIPQTLTGNKDYPLLYQLENTGGNRPSNFHPQSPYAPYPPQGRY